MRVDGVVGRWYPYVELTRLNRPIGTWLLLWPTWWALFLAAGGWPGWDLMLVFSLGTLFMRSAGCAINDYADRDFDRHVKRTQDRPLTSGRLSPKAALWTVVVLTSCATLLLLALPMSTWPWAVLAALIAGTYPLTKRMFAMPQVYLGVAFSMGIPMAYVAIQGDVSGQAGWLMLANLCWTVAYDTEYAMVDRDDDLKLGLKTSAITLGRWDVLGVGVCYALALAILQSQTHKHCAAQPSIV